MNVFYLTEDLNTNDSQQHKQEQKIDDNQNKSYFEIEIPQEAKFQLNTDDWCKLKSLQKGHRFLRGEWEDYFIMGMKESNKYCVFAFKDHYVNQTNFRKRNAKMEVGGQSILNDNNKSNLTGKKIFSSNGYCVFEDCSIKFCLKMNDQLIVHVFYSGKLKHSLNEVHARHFRGKSRQDLKEILKHTTPLKEYMHRIQTSSNLDIGNADYVGKSHSVYRRIAAEAKDCYQSLLLLRNQLIDRSIIKLNKTLIKINSNKKLFEKIFIKGYIQLIQHIPGCIICFNHEQICLYNNLFLSNNLNNDNICLSINLYMNDSLLNTTINSKSLSFYELCIIRLKSTQNQELIPISFMLTTEPESKLVILEWINLIIENEKKLFFFNYSSSLSSSLSSTLSNNDNKFKYIIVNYSIELIEVLINIYLKQDLIEYTNNFFKQIYLNKKKIFETNVDQLVNLEDINLGLLNDISNEDSYNESVNNFQIHICTNQFMFELKQLCKEYYSYGNNFNFGMYAFSCILNSISLDQLQTSLYAFMCILYSKTINKLVEKCFIYLKTILNSYESLKKTLNENEFYIYNATSFDLNDNSNLNKSSNNTFIDLKLNNLNRKCIFFKMCERIFEKCKYDIDKYELVLNEKSHNLSTNPRMGHKLLYKFINQFSSLIPFWTKIKLNDLLNNHKQMPQTLQLHDDRFEKIRSIVLNNDTNETKDSLDCFIKKLEEENEILIDKYINLYALNYHDEFNNYMFKSLSNLNNKDSILNCLIINENEKIDNDLQSSNITNETKCKLIKKNELIKPKMSYNKRFRRVSSSKSQLDENEDNLNNLNLFNLVCLNNETCSKSIENENDEREFVVERQHHIISNEFGFDLSKEDLETLEGLNSPNSVIIEFYMKLLELKTTGLFVYPVNFYPILKYGYNSESNYSSSNSNSFYLNTNFDLFKFNLVFIPIQKTDHWALAAIDFKQQKITYYDSLLLNDFDCLKYLTEYIDKEYMKKNQVKFDFKCWKISNEKNIAKQINSKESSLFIMFYAKRIIQNKDLVTSSNNEIEEFRNMVKKEIFTHIFT